MAEKKTAKKVATSAKTATKISIVINAENVGFKAGDVYQTLASANKALKPTFSALIMILIFVTVFFEVATFFAVFFSAII